MCKPSNLIIAFVLMLPYSLIGQSFHFPDSNAIWSIYDEKYFVQGDTIFNSLRYKKYYKSNDSIVTSGSYFAMLREDTSSKRIYAIPAGSDHENLLYDFSLNLNDTCSVYPFSLDYFSGSILVQAVQIDSILLNNHYRPRIKVEDYWGGQNTLEYWIAGIGSTFGLFYSGLSALGYADIPYPTLLCFEQNDTLIFDNPYFNDCYEHYPIGIAEDHISEQIEIYPNPLRNRITVNFLQLNNREQRELIIYNNLGMAIININVPQGEETLQLNISNLTSGIYILRIKIKGKCMISRKIIIIR